jgi:GNAT superfamily N-acetyltransferase
VSAAPRIKQIDSPDDPDLEDLSNLMDVTFADPNIVLGLERMREFLAANRPGAPRRFCILVATDPARAGAVVGGSVFSHVPHSNCGFSEYIVADGVARGRGIGRQLFEARKEVLDTEARRFGYDACRGLFIEVEHPDRVPADFAAIERETALEGWERLRLFHHLGFRRVQVPYVQPPLAPDKQPIDYMDLLFAPWQAEAASSGRIPTEWIFDTLEAIWSAWSPDTAATYLDNLKQRVGTLEVSLQPAWVARPPRVERS